jgi:hypothetical protein
MELSFDQIHTYWETRHPGQRIPAREKAAVCCVLHHEQTPSCTLYLDGNGGFNCHACGAKGNLFQFETQFSNCTLQQAELNVAEITGARPSPSLGDLGPPVAFYDYRDENGAVLYQKRRFEPELKPKTFLIFRLTSKGFMSRIDPPDGPKTRRVLYNLPDVVKANVVFLCEGEKDCINLAAANLFPSAGFNIAYTCTYDGAWKEGQSGKWLEYYNAYFAGKQVFIFADNDKAGKEYAEAAAAGVGLFAYNTRIVTFPELPEKGDVSDYLELHTVAELEAKVKAAEPWKGKASDRESWLVEGVGWAGTANPVIAWLVDGAIQPDANGIIAAEPKTGKSMAALDLLISLSSGKPWLGRTIGRRIRTAYVSREDSPVLTKTRLSGLINGKSLGVDLTDWMWINTREQLGSFDVDNDEHLLNMAHDLKERGVEFTVLDVLNRLHSRSENDNTEMVQVVERISQMGRYAGCAIGLIHHVSKENGTSGRFFTRIRGASAIHGWTEWSVGLSLANATTKEGALIRRAEFETKAAAPCEPVSFTIDFKGDNLSLTVVSEKAEEERKKEEEKAVAAVAAPPPVVDQRSMWQDYYDRQRDVN